MDGDVRICGDLLVGVNIEVDSFLNEQLQAVADKIKVDGDGDASDDGRSDKRDNDDENKLEVVREASFQNLSDSLELEGSPESGQVQINNLLPDGKAVRDIQQVHITFDGSPVLEARF